MFISQWLYWYLGLSTSEQDLDQEDILGHATLFMFGWNAASPCTIFFHADLGRTRPQFFPVQGKSGSPSWDQHGGNATSQPAAWGQRRQLRRSGALAKNWMVFSKVFIPRAETHCPRHSTKTRRPPRPVCSQPKCKVPLWLLNKLINSREVPSTWINTGHLCKTKSRSYLKITWLQGIQSMKGCLFNSLPQQWWARFNCY